MRQTVVPKSDTILGKNMIRELYKHFRESVGRKGLILRIMQHVLATF